MSELDSGIVPVQGQPISAEPGLEKPRKRRARQRRELQPMIMEDGTVVELNGPGPTIVTESSRATIPLPQVMPAVAEVVPIPVSASTDDGRGPIWVEFEIEGFGYHEAPVFDVLVLETAVVLVYNLANKDLPRYYPAKPESARMALQVRGQTAIYLVEPLGIRFKYRDMEYCILQIVNEAE